MSVPNYYERIPKDLLHTADNPNYHLHHLKLPFRSCIVAPSGSGKTNFLVHMIHLFCQGRKGTFKTIQIVTRNKDEPFYNWLARESEGSIVITEGMNTLPKVDNFDKKFNHLVVVDDLVLSKNQETISDYYIRARKFECSVVYISQKFYAIPQMIRTNSNYMFLLRLSGQREINMILSEFSLGVSKEQLLRLYDEATSAKFQPLTICIDEPDKNQKFRAGLENILHV